MKHIIPIFISSFVVLGVCLMSYAQSNTSTDTYQQQAERSWTEAAELVQQGRYLEAIQFYQKGIESEKQSSTPRLLHLSEAFHEIGYRYQLVGQYDKAIVHYEQALELVSRLGNNYTYAIGVILNNIGCVYKAWGHYIKAIDYYEQALEIDRKLGNEAEVAIRLNNIAGVYRAVPTRRPQQVDK
jgi:tetratricopeptide (TPR) repeat protein